eukprot:2715993-Amphidinium_carterae.1
MAHQCCPTKPNTLENTMRKGVCVSCQTHVQTLGRKHCDDCACQVSEEVLQLTEFTTVATPTVVVAMERAQCSPLHVH